MKLASINNNFQLRQKNMAKPKLAQKTAFSGMDDGPIPKKGKEINYNFHIGMGESQLDEAETNNTQPKNPLPGCMKAIGIGVALAFVAVKSILFCIDKKETREAFNNDFQKELAADAKVVEIKDTDRDFNCQPDSVVLIRPDNTKVTYDGIEKTKTVVKDNNIETLSFEELKKDNQEVEK